MTFELIELKALHQKWTVESERVHMTHEASRVVGKKRGPLSTKEAALKESRFAYPLHSEFFC